MLAVTIASGVLFGGALWLARGLGLAEPATTPPFLQGLNLAQGTGSPVLLATWVVFFAFNILGEELFWRGYILPRQELAFGSRAWMINGALWALFHLSFGWSLLLMLLPLLFVAPWPVQRRRNVWLGIILHGLYNGVPSLLLALGVLG